MYLSKVHGVQRLNVLQNNPEPSGRFYRGGVSVFSIRIMNKSQMALYNSTVLTASKTGMEVKWWIQQL